MHLRISCVFAVSAIVLFALGGCSSSDNKGTADSGTPVPEAGTPDDSSTLDADTCGKLPPSGATQIVAPADGTERGQGALMTFDKSGRPVVAYLDHPSSQAATLYVQRWDDCKGAWRDPQKVDDAIPVETAPSKVVAIANDASDGRIAIAYLKTVHLVTPPRANDTEALYVAVSSDDGATFTPAKVSMHKAETDGTTEGDINDVHQPAIALGGGKTYVAYFQDYSACGNSCAAGAILATGSGSTYAYENVKDSADTEHGGNLVARSFPIGLALDSTGKPGVVVHKEPPTAYNTVVAYWRPGDTTFATVTDSKNKQNDEGSASLTYDGLKPRVVTRLQQGAIGSASDYEVVFSASDDGAGWTTVAVPASEHVQTGDKVFAKDGSVTIVSGGPHVFTSTDLTTFKEDKLGLDEHSIAVCGVFGGDGKLWAAIEGTMPYQSDALGGVVLYRAP